MPMPWMQADLLEIPMLFLCKNEDVVILNKLDLVSPDGLEELEKEIHSINSLANVVHSVRFQVDISIVLNCRAYDASHAAHLEQLLEENKSLTTKDLHDSGMRTMCISDSHQVDFDKVQVLTQTVEEMQEKHELQQKKIEEMTKCEEAQRKELEDLKAKSKSETEGMKKTIAAMMKFLPNMSPPS